MRGGADPTPGLPLPFPVVSVDLTRVFRVGPQNRAPDLLPRNRSNRLQMLRRAGGEASCTARSCRWRQYIEVSGGDAELRREQERALEEQERHAHPWEFFEFHDISDVGAPLRICSGCSAVVADAEAHRRWHEQAER